MSDQRSTKLWITFVAFLVLLNYPVLSITDHQRLFGGVPLLYGYLFLVWLALIVIVGWIVRKKKK
ncbi:MAG TPA: hypothetical protein PK971_03985 [Saprospiraceae bacterium]|nr:hypothetical protein [Saprospiraceae bacterium]HND87461.1 hypothetical protein [Saprospiraceae bacterium]